MASQKELLQFIREIENVYGAIAEKIEELLILINELGHHNSNDPSLAVLIEKIDLFLDRLIDCVKAEKRMAASMKNKELLCSIKIELDKIKELDHFVILAKKRPKPEVIKKIHSLYQEVEREITKQEALA